MEKIGINFAFLIVPIVLLLLYALGVVLVIGVGVWLGLRLTHRSNFTAQEAPLGILKLRYARGEITKEQYEEMKHDLE